MCLCVRHCVVLYQLPLPFKFLWHLSLPPPPLFCRWHCFNDRSVSDLDEASVQSPHAYLLFYLRRDTATATLQSLFPRTGKEPVDVSKIGSRGPASVPRCSVM